MKTVKDLIEFLKTQDQSLKVRVVYDGMDCPLNIFRPSAECERQNILYFSDSTNDPKYEYPEILFTSGHREV